MNCGKVTIVEGIIGAGKSTFSKELSQALGEDTLLLLEPDEKDNANPYLSSFYENQSRWAFTMQVHLLQARYKMHLNAQWHSINGNGNAVLDRSYFGDTAFARLQIKNGSMSENEFETYRNIYHSMTSTVLLPNFCVHLMVNPIVAIDRIKARMEKETGRKCETTIDVGYLYNLYEENVNMINVLRNQGVNIIEVPWDQERDNKDSRAEIVEKVAQQILSAPSPSPFLDLHRRTI
mgnify:FL=1|tara:strand:+ start:68 stop:772 length:705 start_codon:yes stop_codon:yes gene_type:complete